jgi:hypothetical protein
VHDSKREVVIYDYVDRDVPVLARMAGKRAAGYSAIGYAIGDGGGLFDRRFEAPGISETGIISPSPPSEIAGA